MTGYTISYSGELMRNFVQDEILAPDAKFQALQTTSGASLLFSIGTDDTLYLTREVPGTRTGWARADISSALISRQFGAGSGARCANFATAQCPFGASATIHLAMVVSVDKEDHLFLSLNNSDADTSWADAPAWTAFPFDDPDHKLPQVRVVNVFLSEATGKEYIVVDVLRDPSSGQNLVYRYYIDPAKPGGYAWHPHDLAIDLSASGYTSCLGRKSGQALDGLYTAGQISGRAQLIYQPLYNPYGTTPPPPSRFSLPGGRVAEAIAASRKADNTSDLYLTSGSALYYLASKSQQDGAVAVKLADSPMFAGVRDLFAAPAGSGVIVWGLNVSNQVFYTTCTSGNPAAGPWSLPLPIVTGAEQVSPYLDRAADANTFFCHTGTDTFTKAVKSPDTGMWAFRDITLEPPDTKAPARDVPSYSTQVRITDADGQPAANLPVQVQASNVTGLYINYLHYVAGPVKPVQVMTDSNGAVTIVEPVTSLAGSQLTVIADGTSLAINPMDSAFRKAAGLTTADALSSAVITSPDGSTQPFIPHGTKGADLQAVAAANQALGEAYTAHQDGPSLRAAVSAGGLAGLIVDAGDLIATAWGDVMDACQVVLDEARGVWNLVLTIGGQVLRAELDKLEHIVASIGEFLSKIVEYIEDVIKFLEFLFEWQDIARTKEVLKTVLKTCLSYQVGRFAEIRAGMDQQILNAEAVIAGWAGHPEWASLSGTPAGASAGAPGPSSPGSMLQYHYQNNAGGTTQLGADPSVAPASPGDPLAQAFQREGETLYAAVSRLVDLASRLPTMALPDIAAELLAIVGEAVLESARNLLDPLLDLLGAVASAVLSVLDTPLHIPVVSDVLNFFGVPDFSFLDLICWVGAIPATLVCKVVAGSAPFPDNAQTASLIGAPDWPSVLALFGAPVPHVAAAPAVMPAAAARVMAASAVDKTAADKGLFCAGHVISSACTVAAGLINFFEAELDADNPLSKWSGLAGVLGGAGQGVTGYAVNKIVPYQPIENSTISDLNDYLLGARVGCKVVGAVLSTTQGQPLNRTINLGPVPITNNRGLFAMFDLVLAVAALGPVIGHFVELDSADPRQVGTTIASVDEMSNVTAIVSRICYAIAVNSPMGSRETVITAMDVADGLTGVLQLAEAPLPYSG